MNQLQVVQNNTARTILDLPKYASATQAIDQLTCMETFSLSPLFSSSRGDVQMSKWFG